MGCEGLEPPSDNYIAIIVALPIELATLSFLMGRGRFEHPSAITLLTAALPIELTTRIHILTKPIV